MRNKFCTFRIPHYAVCGSTATTAVRSGTSHIAVNGAISGEEAPSKRVPLTVGVFKSSMDGDIHMLSRCVVSLRLNM